MTTATKRDYAGEMRKVIDAATGEGGYVPIVAAGEIVEKLRATDPELLSGWLDAQAEQILRHAINLRDCGIRARVRATRSRGVFTEAVKAHDAGESSGLRNFLVMPFTIEDGSRRQLAQLTATDLTFVAGTYEQRERDNRLMKVFLSALAKKVRGGVVSDHYSNDQLSAMFDGLTK